MNRFGDFYTYLWQLILRVRQAGQSYILINVVECLLLAHLL